MFDQSLLETKLSRARRPWSALLSFGLQSAVVLLLIVVPLFHPEGISALRALAAPVMFAAPYVGPREVHPATEHLVPRLNVLTYSRAFPVHANTVAEESPVAPELGECPPVCGHGNGDPIPFALNTTAPNVVLDTPAPAKPKRVRISQMNAGDLIYRVQPRYPPMAATARIEGAVMLAAVIGRDGTVQNLRVVSGHPMLSGAAVEAVRQWRYRPYVLNGEPVEVDTQVMVNFTLGR